MARLRWSVIKRLLTLASCGAVFWMFLAIRQLADVEKNADLNIMLSPWKPLSGHVKTANGKPAPQPVERPQSGSCQQRTNIVYVKMFKCASETLVNIFRRFGYERNLSFVLPLSKKIYVGWPYSLTDQFFRPSKKGGYNISCEQVLFDHGRFQDLMPKDTVYITSLREPFSQFKSTFNYFAFQRVINLTGHTEPLADYLEDIERYDNIYKSKEHGQTRYCIPDGISISKNLMSYTLGFPTGFPPGTTDMTSDTTFIDDWLQKLDSKFSFVIITEYFFESMIVLKRLMCWQLSDIVYHSQNIGVYSYRHENRSNLVDIYRKWSPIDYQLYHHFNQTLWTRISQQDDDFWEEVRHYKVVLQDVRVFCDKLLNEKEFHENSILDIPGTAWDNGMSVDKSMCQLMTDNKLVLDQIIEQYSNSGPSIPEPVPNVQYC